MALCRAAQSWLRCSCCLLQEKWEPPLHRTISSVGSRGLTPDHKMGSRRPPVLWHPSTPARCDCSSSARSEPWNSRKSVGATVRFVLLYLLQASIVISSRNSGTKESVSEVRPGLRKGPLPGSPFGMSSPQLTNAGHRHCSLEHVYGAVHGRLDTGEHTGSGRDGLRDRVQAQGGGCDEAQCPLGSHKEPGQVVASCTLPGPRRHTR